MNRNEKGELQIINFHIIVEYAATNPEQMNAEKKIKR